jgi:hypothetical protein
MTVAELIQELQKQDPARKVRVSVGWAKDTAVSDDGEPVDVAAYDNGTVVLQGWLSNCSSELEFEDGE